MQAVILAGGKGRRLHPFTTDIPKPLVPLGDTPIIEMLLHQMKKTGVNDVVIAVNHKAEMIKEVLKDGSHLGLRIRYSHEEQELSTVAPLKLIDQLADTFIVANGDILTDLNFQQLFDNHKAQQSQLTITVLKRQNKIDYGVLETDAAGLIKSFQEKPSHDYLVSCGIYMFSKSILKHVPENTPFGFDDLMEKLLKENIPINSFLFDGFWRDIGRPEDYEKAQTEYQRFL